jgi:hypothetical protein
MSNTIRDIKSLDLKIQSLKERQKDIEFKLDESMQNLKANYFGMTINSFFGEKKKKNGNFWGDMAGRFMESEKLQSGVGNFVEKMANKLGDLFQGKK